MLDSTGNIDQESDAGKRTKFFDLSLLKDPTYLVILISNSTNAIVITNFIILLFRLMELHWALTMSLAAYLISIVLGQLTLLDAWWFTIINLGFNTKEFGIFIGGLAFQA
ncbi:hypothetical protein CVS40_9294 [Lucilia cuprina]|nr:hypothetical protein CVS40_9294 [Lucilia cuprina]